jgi:hypothetical protein
VRVCVRVRPAKSGDGCTLNVAPDDKNVTLEYNGKWAGKRFTPLLCLMDSAVYCNG